MERKIYKLSKVQKFVKSSASKCLKSYEGMAGGGCPKGVTARYTSHAPPPLRLRPSWRYEYIYMEGGRG